MNPPGRAIRSATWAGSAAPLVMAVGFVRSVLLARLLPIEVFGVYALAVAIVSLSGSLAAFGLGEALLHRSSETAEEEPAAATHFTLTGAASLCWVGLLATGTLLWAPHDLGTALLALTLAHAGWRLTLTPRAILARRVEHRRLAAFAVVEAVAGAAAAVSLARGGFGLWALLSVDAVRCVLALLAFYAWRPVWRPRLSWSGSRVRYFLRFGSRNVVGTLLDTALQRLDKLWLGVALDRFELGLYSRADRFARIPANLLGGPIVSVSGGVFAALGSDRERLSQVVFWATAVVVRVGLGVAGTLALVAPEFVALVLGDRWLPIVPSMRILVAAVPLALTNRTLAQLFLACGRPAAVARVRGTQVAALAAGLVMLGPGLGRSGAAASVAVASLVGLVLSLREAREHVELSSRALFLAPILALGVSMSGTTLATVLLATESTGVATAALKAAAAIGLYGLVLWGLERRELPRAMAWVLREFRE